MPESKDLQHELNERINALEEAYEFMLAYAAQGRQGEESGTGDNIRTFLERADAALEGLGPLSHAVFQGLGAVPTSGYQKFIEVLGEDAQKAQAAIRMVLSLPSISSQLTDNLNSSIHLRTLLTDLFLIDEVLKTTYKVIRT